MGNCKHEFGHRLNIVGGTGYYMCSLCEMEITEEHYAALIRCDLYKEALEKIASNKYAAFTCIKIAREALNG